jgi:predicted DNA-binding transcriptional regulator AlpA
MEAVSVDVRSVVDQFWSAHDNALFPQSTLAAATGMSNAFYERARWSGDGPKFMKIGRLVRYRKADVLEWLNRGKSAASTGEVVGIPGLRQQPRKATPNQLAYYNRGKQNPR